MIEEIISLFLGVWLVVGLSMAIVVDQKGNSDLAYMSKVLGTIILGPLFVAKSMLKSTYRR